MNRVNMNINLDQKLKRIVLEIEVEKDSDKNELILTEVTLSKLSFTRKLMF